MSYEERLKAWEKNRFAPPPGPDLEPFSPTFTKMLPMRDGISLYTEIFLPPDIDLSSEDCSNVPIILMRSCYPYSLPSHSDRRPLSRYLERGFGIAFQLTRGQGASEGSYRFYTDDINDGYDTIQWISEQPWCTGKVGMEGPSYLGSTQMMAAKSKPPALKCIMPTAFIGDFTKVFAYYNGVPGLSLFLQWHKVADLKSWDDLDVNYGDNNILKHPVWGPTLHKKPLIDAAEGVLTGTKLESWIEGVNSLKNKNHWDPIHFSDEELKNLDIPIFFTDGWYDTTVGPIDFFCRLEDLKPGDPNHYLLVGPWNHYQTYNTGTHDQDNGERKMHSNAKVDLIDQRLAFFEHYLKGDTKISIQKNRVKVFITGPENSNANQWLDLPTFPSPNTDNQTIYLHSAGHADSFPGDGMLSNEKPGNETHDIYYYNPDLPTPFSAETLNDQREVEIRADVLTYTTAPFEDPVTILGEMQLVLYAASDCLDTDWFAQLTEVFPDGKSIAFNFAISAIRARYREGLKHEKLLTPNKAEKFSFSLGTAGHQIAAGNSLRLSISSANFPLCYPNTNTGNEVTTDTEAVTAKQMVFHDSDHPSHIILPVIDIDKHIN